MHDYFIVSQWNGRRQATLRPRELQDIVNDPKLLTAADAQAAPPPLCLPGLRDELAGRVSLGHGLPPGQPEHVDHGHEHAGVRRHAGQGPSACSSRGATGPRPSPATTLPASRASPGAAYECPHYTLGVTMKQLAEANVVLQDGRHRRRLRRASDSRSACAFTFNWLLPPDLRFNGKRTDHAHRQYVVPVGAAGAWPRNWWTITRIATPTLAGQVQWFANQTLPGRQADHAGQGRGAEAGQHVGEGLRRGLPPRLPHAATRPIST